MNDIRAATAEVDGDVVYVQRLAMSCSSDGIMPDLGRQQGPGMWHGRMEGGELLGRPVPPDAILAGSIVGWAPRHRLA